jgi:SNF2 family DNA or RNA helicase
MGTGKTMMAISLAAVAAGENMNKNLIVSPPHLVYKWRREILNTIPDSLLHTEQVAARTKLVSFCNASSSFSLNIGTRVSLV